MAKVCKKLFSLQTLFGTLGVFDLKVSDFKLDVEKLEQNLLFSLLTSIQIFSSKFQCSKFIVNLFMISMIRFLRFIYLGSSIIYFVLSTQTRNV